MASGLKTEAGQRMCRMKSYKDTEHRREETALMQEKRKQVIESSGSCLTCSHISAQRGIFLYCSMKQKNVRQYNFCEKWKGEESK